MQLNNLGNELECEIAGIFHQQGVPLLISHQILRDFDCGQVDVALIGSQGTEQVLRVIECKSGVAISRRQMVRLQRAAQFLSQLLQIPSKLEIISKKVACQLAGQY